MNAGRAEPMKIGARTITTGIRKAPVERGHVGTLGLVGDVVADREDHGGPDQAIYVYSSEDYAWWGEELGGAPEPGTFGENLTLSSFGPEPVRIGDRYRVGQTLLEVTAPRIPCSTFADANGRAELGAAVRRRAEAGALRPRARAGRGCRGRHRGPARQARTVGRSSSTSWTSGTTPSPIRSCSSSYSIPRSPSAPGATSSVSSPGRSPAASRLRREDAGPSDICQPNGSGAEQTGVRYFVASSLPWRRAVAM